MSNLLGSQVWTVVDGNHDNSLIDNECLQIGQSFSQMVKDAFFMFLRYTPPEKR